MNHKQYVPKAIAVCPKCKSKLTLFHIIERRDTDFYMKDRITYYCGICENQLKPEDFLKIEEEKVEVSKMGIKNLTEAEEKEFCRLVGKMNGEEPDKEQDVKVRKPRQSEEYFYINDDGAIIQSRWTNDSLDNGRWELGNVFFTKESAWFAREKKKIKTELQRFADKYNDPEKEAWNNDNGHYMIAFNHRVNDLFITRGYYIEEESATYSFTSDSIARDAIEAVGKDRILKYIFGVESEGEE